MKRNRACCLSGLGMLLLGTGMMLTSCVATTTPYGSASIISEPPSAKVVNLKDGSELGSTPLIYTWETEGGKQEYIQLKLSTEGYKDQVTEFFVNPRYDNKEDAEKNPQVITVKMKQAQ